MADIVKLVSVVLAIGLYLLIAYGGDFMDAKMPQRCPKCGGHMRAYDTACSTNFYCPKCVKKEKHGEL